MAPMATELATLRALTFRISSTATSQLPQHVPAIAASLASCRLLLSSPQASASKSSSEISVAVHKYRTLLSTLLQDRTIQGRWAAIVLIKSTIEIGGWETLQKSLPWVRGLLGILTKPDPPSSKKLCLIALTRIFILTREYPTLVREITTPSLPAFMQSSLQIATSRPSASLLQVILECYTRLLPRHPTIFRSYLKQLQQLLRQTIAPTPSSNLSLEQIPGLRVEVTSDVSAAARQLYTQLPCCAPKGASDEEWQDSFKKTIENTHHVSDKVFRAVVEDWKPSKYGLLAVNGHTLDDEVQTLEADYMALPPWSGIFAGGERLVNLLRLIKEYLECPTAGAVSFDASAIVDLLMRLFSLTVPSAGNKSFQNTVRFNNQVSKEERENLWLILPDMHVAAIEILLALTRRCDATTIAIDAIVLDQLSFVFSCERDTPKIRTACYLAVAKLLMRSGVALPKSSIEPLSIIIRMCCDDILPLEQINNPSKQASTQNKPNGNNQQALTNADAFLSSSKKAKDPTAKFEGLTEAAYSLLPILYAYIRPHHLSHSLRTRLDRTAILVGHKNAMMASVLNQPPSTQFGKPNSSILPLLARNNSHEKDVEALLRPRMPIIRTGGQDSEVEDENGDEEDEMEEDRDEDDHFVGHELDILLETAANTDSAKGDLTISERAITDKSPALVTSFNPPNTDDVDRRDFISEEDAERPRSDNKRPQEAAPLSPTKRLKVDEEIRIPTQPASTATLTPTIAVVSASAPLPNLTTVSSVSTTSQNPFSTVQDKEEEDSDDEDVPLVLGQDTDEESD